jgi:glucose-1-phosphate adenylyltransferase
MGIYVFNTEYLFDELRRDASDPESTHDFGKDIIPRLVREARVFAHPFHRSCVRSPEEPQAYWRDVGTLDAYYAANIDLTDVVPGLDLYDRAWPIWTYNQMLAPAKFVHDEDERRGIAISSLVAGGCIISGASLRGSLVFSGVRMHSYSSAEDAVILPEAEIGRGAKLRKVVVEKGVIIPEGLQVGWDPELDAQRFRRTESGVCLITKKMIEALGR